ncbi:MAG: RNA methyltransferase [Bacteroidota bacterium]
MLTKATAKLIQSLKDKRNRQESGLFVIEGAKIIAELPASKITLKSLFATRNWLEANKELLPDVDKVEVTEQQLKQISFLQTPQQVLALAYIPDVSVATSQLQSHFSIVLDTLQDPGNLGTIIRIADWYGIKHIVCSTDSVDVYNPKVVQATMGSFLRVNVVYTSLEMFFSENKLPVYGAVMDGANLYATNFLKQGLLLIGNEGSGIEEGLMKYISHPVTIPRQGRAESLNAGIATAIICDAWARQNAS